MDYLLHGLSLPRTLLGLSDINIENITLNQHHEILIQVNSTQAETTCRCCGHPTKPYGQGKTLKLRHLPILEQTTFIVITPPRGQCEQCEDHPITTQTLSWYEQHAQHTKIYETHVLQTKSRKKWEC